jgi:hypothetical protein
VETTAKGGAPQFICLTKYSVDLILEDEMNNAYSMVLVENLVINGIIFNWISNTKIA